jgi:hypothetical protein
MIQVWNETVRRISKRDEIGPPRVLAMPPAPAYGRHPNEPQSDPLTA